MKSENGKVINAYYTSWANYGRKHTVKKLGELIKAGVTDVSYAFFNLVQEGQGWVIKSGDEWADYQNTFGTDTWENSEAKIAGNFGQFKMLKEQGYEFNLHLSVGGWTWSKNFSNAVATEVSRQMFSESVITLFKKFPVFTGIDFDWEYLSSDGVNYGNEGNVVSKDDPENYIKFLKLMRNKLQANGMGDYIIGQCTVAAPEKAIFPIREVVSHLDELRIMTYDFAGAWDNNVAHQANPLLSSHGKYSTEEAVKFYLDAGVPPEKLMIGAAFYSRGWSGTDGLGKKATGNSPDHQFSEEMGVVPYHMLPMPGAVEMWDDEAKAGYSYDASKKVLNTYDTIRSINEKGRLIHKYNLKGIIIWESAGDVEPGHERSLVSALRKSVLERRDPGVLNPNPPVLTAPVITTPSVPAPSVPSSSVPVPSVPGGSYIEFKAGLNASLGQLVAHKGVLYEVINPHNMADHWLPEHVPSLFKKLGPVPSVPIPSVPTPPTPMPSIPMPSIPMPSIPMPSVPSPMPPAPPSTPELPPTVPGTGMTEKCEKAKQILDNIYSMISEYKKL